MRCKKSKGKKRKKGKIKPAGMFFASLEYSNTVDTRAVKNRIFSLIIPSLLICGLFTALLTACGDGDSNSNNNINNNNNNDGNSNRSDNSVITVLPISDFRAIPGDKILMLSWTNPNSDDIAGFNIVRFDANNPGDRETIILTSADNVSFSSSAAVSYIITGLTNDQDYTVTVFVVYDDGISVESTMLERTPGDNADGDDLPDSKDNCPAEPNSDQRNTDNDVMGDACDPDDDNDEVLDEDDAFPLDACASTDTDNDSEPDTVVTDCQSQTNLKADQDDDNDGVNDGMDNCPLLANTDQDNADKADDGGDACDPDDDNDDVPDETDVDDNNNSLIEIRTLDELARLRDDLNGDGTDDGNNDTIIAVGSEGCPSSGCLGYELTRSLNFSQEESYGINRGNRTVWTNRSGSGWQPIGFCVADNDCTSYAGIFDGGGYAIADLFVSADDDARGLGLFGAFNGSLQNLHLLNARVSGGARYVGGLVGYGRNADYENLSVTGGSVMSPSAERVGGLIGDGEDAGIRYANAFGVNVSGDNRVGGLVGDAEDANIRYANVFGVNVSGSSDSGDNVGGLVGAGRRADIRYVNVSDANIFGVNHIGGLVGDSRHAGIRYANVSGGSVIGKGGVGGLVGDGRGVNGGPGVNISDAYVFGGDVFGNARVGGLVGDGGNANIRYAYVSGGSVTGNLEENSNHIGGLVGEGRRANICYAYASGLSVLGNNGVGGLVGGAPNADMRYVFVSGVGVSGGVDMTGSVGIFGGNNHIGGLVGDGPDADIRHAYVSGGSVSGNNKVGGLVGRGLGAQIHYSYAASELVSGTGNISGLIGFTDDQTVVTVSYWDTDTTRQPASPDSLGEGKTTTELQSPSSFTGIYALWGNFLCNPDTGEEMESTSASQQIAPGFMRVWDLGESFEYPALNCMRGAPPVQDKKKGI